MAMNLGLTVTLPAGNPYQGEWTLQLGECSGIDDLDCIRETGLSVFEAMQELSTKSGRAAIVAAIVVWLARRREFPHMTFQQAASSITWDTEFELADANPDVGKGEGSAAKPNGSESSPTSPTSTESDPGNSTD